MFRSFFLAGFECATGYNMHGQWMDQVVATQHDLHVDSDYRALADLGIRAVREAMRWPLIDRGGRYDFSSVEPFVRAAARHEMDVIWDLFHYGYPDGLDPFSPEFPPRFAEYCRAAARWLAARTDAQAYFTPVNEPSFFSWAAGQVGRFAPHVRDRGGELKIALARACILGIDAIRDVLPGARMVNVDPICRVVPPFDAPERAQACADFNDLEVFEAWDMIAGRLHPELGGSRAHLDIVGINYYWTNQWELGRPEHPLADHDPRRATLSALVSSVWQRYGGELLITETSHVGEMRPVWLLEAAAEAERLLGDGVPLRGVCLYPILGMPEWHDPTIYTCMGLWDPCSHRPPGHRQLFTPMLAALRQAQRLDGLHAELLGRRTVPLDLTAIE